MNSFIYSADTINKIIEDNKYKPVVMQGVRDDLRALKSVIEKIYDKKIFYLDYWMSECGYHGWSWSKDNGEMANMAKITQGISEKFVEIYAMILGGLGEKCETTEEGQET